MTCVNLLTLGVIFGLNGQFDHFRSKTFAPWFLTSKLTSTWLRVQPLGQNNVVFTTAKGATFAGLRPFTPKTRIVLANRA